MAHRRSNFPARIQRILSGGGAAIPSLPMEFEPPSNVKAFIDRVIKSPLHDIDIPLSGFHWEYNKGNFHHWVPLFLHFNTYFKTYISCRKDLLLVDNMSDDDPFPKHSVLQILRVMQIVLLNCYNKSSFDGLEHFKLLLSSTDPDILLATLETLTAFVKINPSKIHGSGAKLIGCGSVNNFLLSLAQAWGSKEESLGLYSCVVANEKSQQGGFSLFPSDVEDNCSGNQYRMGSTLRFEYRRAPPATDEQHNKKGKTTCMSILHIPDLHLRKEDDLTLLRQYVEQYNVPPEHRFSLLTRIRYAHSFRSSRICSLYSRISILAFIVMVQSNDAHDELVSFFANEPEYTNELIRLVRSDDSVPDTVKALAMLALGAELAAYTASHEWARILSGSSTIISSGGNRMVLLTVLQKSVSSVNSQSDPASILFVDALLQFFLLHVLSSSNSGSTIRGSGMIPPLLPLLQNTDPAHMHLVSSAVKNLQKLMEYSNPAVSLLKDLGGVELLAQRLQIEVDRVIGTDGESSSGFIPSDSSKLDVDRLCNQKRLIKVLLKALGSATYSPANSTRSSNSRDDSLPKSLSLIFRNASRFGGDIYFAAVTVMSEIIHKDPTCFTILHDLGLPDAFLSSVVSGVLPSSKALICIPGALGAICLNAKGLEAVRETASLRFLIDSFTTKKYLVAMNEGVVLLANAVEELLRHVSSLRSSGVDIIIEIISKLASTDVEYFGLTDKSDEETTMEIDVENKDSRGKNLVDAMDSDGDIISNDQFLQSCIFHTMVLVHRTVENSETCRLFVEKKGIDALMKLLLQPCIAQSSEGMPVALHSTVVFKGFTQHHSKPLAVAFCSALRGHLNKALDGFKSASDSFLLNPKTIPDSSLLSPLFVIEFLLFLGACKDHRWVAALLIEFGNESKDVLENIGRVHREVLWQVSLLEDSKVESEVTVAASASEAQTSDAGTHDSEEQAFNSLRQDSRLRRRLSGWSIESQFLDLISMYRDIGHASRSLRRMNVDVSTDSRLVPGSHTDASASFVSGSYGSKKETDKQKSYNSSCCDMMKSLSYHMNHLFLELGKAMMLSSRHGSDSLNVPSSVKSVVSLFSSIVLDYLNYRGPTSGLSETDISTKCRYLGKVIDFIDTILLEKPESCNPILLNCFYGCGVVTGILTTFEATSQLLFAVNKAPASPMETDEENMNEDRREVDYSWIYGPLASFGTLMDHLVTSSFIISSSTKQLLEQPIFSGDSSFPRDAEAFVKLLQSKVLKAVLPIWNHPHFAGCNYEFITRIISIMRHVYSGVEVRNVNANNGMRISGPPPDESTISLISEMGFSRSRAEEALTQVGANSVELATDWLFSHPEEPQEDDELARALRLSMGSSNISSNEDSKNAKEMVQEVEMVQLPPVDELLPACIGLLQANESLAFPVKNLLLTISSQNDGECRQRVLNPLIERLRVCAALPDASSCVLLYALFHIFALILNEDKAAREVASKSGLVSIALNLLSQWVPVSCDREKLSVPRWIISSFLAIDLMLQLDSNLSSEVSPEKVKNDDLTHQTQIHTEEIKKNELPFSFELTTGILEPNDKRMLIEISCKCIKNQLPSDTMHVVLRLCATLTKDHSVAVNFLELGGLPALLTLPTKCLFPGFDNVAASIIRHILEDPHTLQQTIESEIRHSFTSTADRHSISRVTPRNFVQSLSSVIARDPVVFMRAAKSICQIEMTGERPYIVLLKDRDKEKVKDKDKDKLADKEKQSAADLNVKNVKVHRKSPQSFTNVIEILLDSITMFLPSNKLDEPIDGALHPPSADMDIDSTSIKGKGKAVATVALDGSKVGNQEDSTSLAKSVFVLKLLTEIILTYHSSVNVLLRRDTDVSNSRALQRGISVTSGGGIFHHLLHRYLPYPGSIKKDKKKDDWRQKLTSKAKQFLVASSLRSTEGRKRIMSEVNNIFLEFIDLSNGCITPDIDMQTLIDLLNDILAARTSTGSYICTEASSTFIDVGLVQSLTRILQVLDLDHADSPKAITGMIKALELVTKEHAHSSDPNSTKGDSSAKVAGNQNEHDRSDNNENRLQSLETSSQPDHNRMMTDLVESLDAIQASGSSDSVTDMDHERDLDVGFVPDGEDFFMHEMSESGRSGDNNGGIANVEISFDIPHNVDNLDDDDDEEMSGDEEVDEDDEDDENNDTDGEEMRHHMSHPETDQDDHDIDEAFDEVLEEEEDDEDDEDGVILRLEEGINGINVFDQIDLFGLAGGSFSNESLRSMPFEVFGSRRQDRNASIYNLMGRAGGLGSSLEHPLLTDPSSLRHLAQAAQQRLSENTVDAAFSDRNTESDSSRLDTVFRSLRSGRHSHRFNTWVDVTRQRGSSNANVPQGIEELLVSQLRRPQPEQTPEQVVSINHPQEPDKDTRQNEPGIALEEVVPAENTSDVNLGIGASNSETNRTETVDVGPADGDQLQELGMRSSNDQVIDMQYEQSDLTGRDVEAVSLESGGSSATLGESLRSLEVEIGSADGHDDGGERQGDATRTRRLATTTIPLGSRDISLESVNEVSPTPNPSGGAGQGSLVNQQNNTNTESGSIDPTFLDALPEELRAEVLSSQQNQVAPPPNDQPQSTGDIDPEFLAALPQDIRAEVLAQQQTQRLHQSQELGGQPIEMDTVSIIATFPSDLREEVLLTSPDAVLASLTPALVTEANMLRERFAHRYHSGTPFGMYPRNRRGQHSRRNDLIGSSLERSGASSHRHLGIKMVEADGSPLVDMDALKALIRLFRVVQPLYRGQLQKLLLNLCAHHETRSSLVKLFMDMLIPDVHNRGDPNCINTDAEPLYRLYACHSHIIYSRPQFSDGVPPLVSRRILETLTYLAKNNPKIARLLLHLELPRPQVDDVDFGRGKAVMVMEEDKSASKKGDLSIVLILSLLNQSLYLRSAAHLEQLLSLLEVIIANAQNDLSISNKTVLTSEQISGSNSTVQDASANADLIGSSSQGVVKSSIVGNVNDTHVVLLNLPQEDLRRLCSLLAHEGLSESAYTLVAEVLKKLVAIVPDHCHLFVTELADSVQKLSTSAMKELQMYEKSEKTLITSCSDGTAILRVLQALSSLASFRENEKNLKDALSHLRTLNASLEPLWSELSNCISKMEFSSESTSVTEDVVPVTALFSNIISTPPLPVGTQNILPYIESFFVACEKLYPGQSSLVPEIGCAAPVDIEDATTSGTVHKLKGHLVKVEEKQAAFVKFSEKHRKMLNSFIRQNPGLLDKSFSLMLKVPRFIDFDNKRAHFRTKIKHQHDHHHSSLRISVRRAYILEDSYNQLRMRLPQDLKGRLTVNFQGEEGIDAGGLTREWYQVLSRVIFDRGALLFTTVGNDSTFQPNPNSVYQTEHLSYFKFVGRVVAKALFDGQLLDVHFTRSFYKHILGVKVTYHDIEAIDPAYYKNLKWTLENDISDGLGLTFSIDADEEQLILYEKAEVSDYELIPGGRNIRVTEENKHQYVDLVAEHRLTTAIRPQINSFMEGFNDLISKDLISVFNDKELELLISGLPYIDLDDLRANTEYSGYSNASPVIQWFWEVVQGFSKEDKARLLQFVTGTSKVPLEGFSALQGISGSQRFQIHKAYGSKDHLPSAHTCFNQLDLPEYPSKEKLQERLFLAIHEANEGFGFG